MTSTYEFCFFLIDFFKDFFFDVDHFKSIEFVTILFLFYVLLSLASRHVVVVCPVSSSKHGYRM